MGFWTFGRRRKRRRANIDEDKRRYDPDLAEKEAIAAPVEPHPSTRFDARPPRYDQAPPALPSAVNGGFDSGGNEKSVSYKAATHKPASAHEPSASVPVDPAREPYHFTHARPGTGGGVGYRSRELSDPGLSGSRPTSWSRAPTLTTPSSSRNENGGNPSSKKTRPENTARLAELRHSTGPVSIPVPCRRFVEEEADYDVKAGKARASPHAQPGVLSESQSSLPGRRSSHPRDDDFDGARSLKVRSVDIISPHPTLKNELLPSNSIRRQKDGGSIDAGSQSPRTPVLYQSDHHGKTIDDLADDLDAATLHQLMDRDEKRREERRRRQSVRAKQKLLDLEARQRLQTSESDAEISRSIDAEKATLSALEALTADSRHKSHPPPVRSRIVDEHKWPVRKGIDATGPAKSGQTFDGIASGGTACSTAPAIPSKPVESSVVAPMQDSWESTVPSSQVAAAELEAPDFGPEPALPLTDLQRPSAAESSESLTRRPTKSGSIGRWSTILRPLNKHSSRDSEANSALEPRSVRHSDTGSTSDFSINRQSTTRSEFRPPYSGTSIRRRSGAPTRGKSRFTEDLPGVAATAATAPVLAGGDATRDLPSTARDAELEARGLPSPAYPPSFNPSPLASPSLMHFPNLDVSPRQHAIRKSASGLSYEGDELSYSQSYASVDSESSWMRPSRRTSKINRQSSKSSINTSRRPTHDGMDPSESLTALDVLAEKDVEAEPNRAGEITNGNSRGPVVGSPRSRHGDRIPNPTMHIVEQMGGKNKHTRPRHEPHAPESFDPFAHEDDGAIGESDFGGSLEDLDREKSIKHARHMSAGSAKLLDIVSSGSNPGSKRSSRLGIGDSPKPL